VSQRSRQARDAALEATVELLHEVGVERLSIEGVAARSGVAKTTIYRHWPGKADLVVDAVKTCTRPLPTPNTGDLRADLRSCLLALRDAVVDSGMARILPSLLDAAQRDPDFADLFERLQEERDLPVRTVLELARLRGALDPDVDLDTAVDLVVGPLLLRLLVTHAPLDDRFVAEVVDRALRGLGASAVVAG
jgi:AcrR family transcriptional regulator